MMNELAIESLSKEHNDPILETIVALVLLVSDDTYEEVTHFNVRDRISFNDHIEMLVAEGQFRNYYRMTYERFYSLRDILRHYIKIDLEQSNARSKGKGPITLESIMTMGIRYLAGGNWGDIRLVCGVSKTSFYRSVYKFLDALSHCPDLQIRFPVSEEEKRNTAAEFRKRSKNDIHRGVLSCVDGWLCEIQSPSSAETNNVAKFFSGHYQTFGLNVQAGCDAHCRFNYLNVRCPGGTNDAVAFAESGLHQLLDEMEGHYYILADNAYIVSEKVLTPFCKTDGMTPARDNYNFYLSQLRIRIEMSFGFLVGKWRIFKRPLHTSLANCCKIITGAMILHNHCVIVNDNIGDDMTVGDEYDPSFLPSSSDAIPGMSVLRNIIVDQIEASNLCRPGRNTVRNRGISSEM